MMKFAPHITIYDFEESKDIQNEVIWSFSKNLIGISKTNQRFNIHVVHNISEERESLDANIKSVWKFVSMELYLSKSQTARRRFLLDLISNSLLDVSHLLGWKKDFINEALTQTLNQRIQFEYLSTPIQNKTRDKAASIELKLDKNKVSIWVIFSFKDKTNQIKKHLIDTTVEHVTFLHNFDKPKWLNEEYFGFQFKNGIILSISPELDQSKWSNIQNSMDEWFKESIRFDKNMTPEELIQLINK